MYKEKDAGQKRKKQKEEGSANSKQGKKNHRIKWG